MYSQFAICVAPPTRLQLYTLIRSVVWILFAMALTLGGNVKGQENADRIGIFINQLRSPHISDRRIAVESLAETIGPEWKKVVPTLIEAMKDKDQDVRDYAAVALMKSKPQVRDEVHLLITALTLKDSEDEVRVSASTALSLIALSLFDSTNTNSLSHLRMVYSLIKDDSNQNIQKSAVIVRRTIDYFESLWWVEARNWTIKAISDHPYISLVS